VLRTGDKRVQALLQKTEGGLLDKLANLWATV